MARSNSKETKRPPGAGREGGADDFRELSEEWNYITDIIFFQSTSGVSVPTSIDRLKDFPKDRVLPSVLFQAARKQLGLSHAQLGEAADVSKKTINDVENAIRSPSPRIAGKLREALEAYGSRFVTTGNSIGVVTRTTRASIVENSRSPRVRPKSVASD